MSIVVLVDVVVVGGEEAKTTLVVFVFIVVAVGGVVLGNGKAEDEAALRIGDVDAIGLYSFPYNA